MKANLRLFNIVVFIVVWIGCVSKLHAQVPNDNCTDAIFISNVVSDAPFVKIQGSTLGALPENFGNECFINAFPTVWYFITADDMATLINLQVTSNDFEAPAISLFHLVTDCNALEKVPLTQYDQECHIGSNGVVLAIANEIQAGGIYYVAVSSPFSVGGDFELSVNTISTGSKCVTSRNIEIASRSFGGPLTGPFFPGETLGVCMHVDTFTSVGTGCQWFQGLVPVFGNGWSPSSFDANGQPYNASINGLPIGLLGNGIYDFGLTKHYSTWDWFTNVGHHDDNAFFQISDFDGNGRLDIGHTLYEPNCPDLGGITGGCCAVCWDNPGTLLPPGWFAYGINGSCADPGPPVWKDWGDGNTCGCCMGPWNFCFDMVIRDLQDCSGDSTMKDLSIGFFTFADGQTGSWSGGVSKCALDQPVKIILPLCCTIPDSSSTTLTPVCSGDVIEFSLNEDSVMYWTWTANAENVIGANNGYGEPGAMIHDTLVNTGDSIELVTYGIFGFGTDPCPVFEKSVYVQVAPGIHVTLMPDQPADICEGDTLSITAEVSGGETPFTFFWTTPGGTTNSDSVLATLPGLYSLQIEDNAGCMSTPDTVLIDVIPNPVVDLGTDTISADSQVILDAGNAVANFLWNTGDTTQILLVNTSGVYSVIVTDSLGCYASDTVYVNLVTSVPYEITQRIHVFPNPNNGVFTINGNLATPVALQIKVLSALGKVVYASTPEVMNANFSKSFDIHASGRGIYFLQIYLGDELIVKKIIVN